MALRWIAWGVFLISILTGCGFSDDDDVIQENSSPPLSLHNAMFGCQSSQHNADQASVRDHYTLFESGQTRPLALSPDGQRLFAVNTPNNCLEVYSADDALKLLATIPVGLEPVAVAAPTNDEVWVVNQLSDSVSVIDLKGVPHIKNTLWVGDEPRDIVFAGEKHQRAFISSAYRGQNHPTFKPSDLRENGHGRADVWVFDRNAAGNNVGGAPLKIINLFSDVPRALAVSNDGTRVYAAAYLSGNLTTVIEEQAAIKSLSPILLGYFRRTEGGDMSFDQMAAITGYSHGTGGMSDEELIEYGLQFGIIARIDGVLVVPYTNSPDFRIDDQGRVVNQATHEVLPVQIPEGVTLGAAPDVPPYVPTRGKPGPYANSEGVIAPPTGLIVKFDGTAWRDEAGTDWSDKVQLSLPDYDVFVINATAADPIVSKKIAHVGTTLFNMAVNPVSGKVYVSNLNANNNVRFEGPGHSSTTVRGNITQSRISIIDNDEVMVRDLNKHLTHSEPQGSGIAATEKAKSLSQPMQMALTADGSTLYVAAMGSNKIGIFKTQALEQDSFQPDASSQITLPASGPTGVILNNTNSRLFVSSRFDNSLRVIDTETRQIMATRAQFSPEPRSIIEGRRFLYDAELTSANGENACSSCHVFGDMDALSWDLGNPEEGLAPMPDNTNSPHISLVSNQFHPMKGPMTTQTLRGINDSGPMHWRGDRTGNERATVNGTQESRESAAFKAFNPAFVSLVGREKPLDSDQMQAFTDFAMQIMLPPNPVRALDNSLSPEQQRGHDLYMFASTTPIADTCNACHELDAQKRHFGSDGTVTGEGGRVSQDFKVPPLRNAYTKVGRFDDNQEQIRGFGFLHDGSEPTLLRFFQSGVFLFTSDEDRNRVSDFLFAIDTNLAPIVGQQVTVSPKNRESALKRLDLLLQRGQLHECDVVASTVIKSKQIQAIANSATQFVTTSNQSISRDALLQTNYPVTFTCYPPGNAQRLL